MESLNALAYRIERLPLWGNPLQAKHLPDICLIGLRPGFCKEARMRSLFILTMLSLVACSDEPEPPVYVPVPLQKGVPLAAVESGYLRLPAGVPMGGYTARDAAFGGTRTRPRDLRQSNWTQMFHPSAGQLTGVPLQTLWLTNGDRHMVILRIDLVAAFDGIVFEIEKRLSAITGVDLKGQVAMVTSHSHSSPAAHHRSLQFALGFDRYDPRVFERIVDQAVSQALRAHGRLAPARLGVGLMPNADPADGEQLWRDRRTENDELLDIDGQPTGPGYKDPSAQILKVESDNGDLLAVLLNVGLHGTQFGDENCWSHWDAPGSVAYGLSAALQGAPVFLLQGAGGDTSPGGLGATPMAKADDLARRSAERLLPLVRATQTSAEPIAMDLAYLSVEQHHQAITVERRGTTEFHYSPVTLDDYGQPIEVPDNLIYDDQGAVIEAIDEFPAPIGAGLCGEAVGVPFGSIGMGFNSVTVYPYDRCAILDRLMPVIASRFEVDELTVLGGSASAPQNVEPAMSASLVAFGHFDALPITTLDAGQAQTAVGRAALMFLPGETTTLLTLRAKRYLTDLGYQAALVIGYAMDHEGYLMTVEDWVVGGYETSINVWGPLQGEYLLETAMQLASRGLSGDRMRTDDLGIVAPDYGAFDLGFEPLLDDDKATPTAGHVVTQLPEEPLLLPLNMDPQAIQPLATSDSVRALTDVYAGTFEGGDVGIDAPVVHLERLINGDFVAAIGRDGLPIDSDGPGVLLGYSPTPPRSMDAERRHLWTIVWQPVGEGIGLGDWAAQILGTYRFVVHGTLRRSSTDAPESYRIELPSFDVEATSLSVVDGIARYAASPHGYRARGNGDAPQEATPLPKDMVLSLTCRFEDQITFEGQIVVGENGSVDIQRPDDGSACSLVDPYGNGGVL